MMRLSNRSAHPGWGGVIVNMRLFPVVLALVFAGVVMAVRQGMVVVLV